MRLNARFARSGTVTALLICCALLVGAACSALASGKGSPTPRPGTYSGFDAVDTISFKVSADATKITALSSTFNPAADCGVPTNVQHERFPTLKIKNGHFKGTTSVETAGSPEHFAITGRFVSPTKATGKISGHFTIKSLPPCHASTTFAVKRKGK